MAAPQPFDCLTPAAFQSRFWAKLRQPVMQVPPEDTHAVPAMVHAPLWQVRPDVQSASVLQPPPAALRAQCPLRHESELQQSVSAVHAPASARQQRVSPWSSAQVVPVAQPGVLPVVHGEPGGSGVVPEVHVVPEHVRPSQQGFDAEHAVPEAPQLRHVPPTHESAGLVHAPVPVALQQGCPEPPHTGVLLVAHWWCESHAKPGSHAAVPQHAWPMPPQGVAEPQLPEVQLSPALQAVPPQQGSASPPHAPPDGPASTTLVPPSLPVPPPPLARHVPLVHVPPALHAVLPQQGWPMAPQEPGVPPPPDMPPPPPGMDMEHAPPMHESPVLQAVPPQQVSPLAPQCVPLPPPPLGVLQLPLVHTRLPLHAVPPQQGCPLAPHAVPPPLEVWQLPALQLRPGLQAVPQHIWPMAPHAAMAGAQVLVASQLRPPLQELPLQQGWSRSPQGVGVVHEPATHESELPVHVAPGQQGWLAPPQAAQVPPPHAKPAEHTSPAQQGWPDPPHDPPVMVTHTPPVQAVPSQQSALVSQRSLGP